MMAGITSAGQMRSREPNTSRASAAQMHQHQEARIRHVVVADALRPLAQAVEVQQAVLDDADTAALAAPTVTMTSITVVARRPRARSYTAGTTTISSTSCLSSAKLSHGSSENADETSVSTP